MNRAVLDFSLEEYEQRIAAVRREMRVRSVDLLVVDQLEHLAYLFGYGSAPHRYQACLLPLEGDPHMIVRELERPTFRDHSWVESYAAYEDDVDAIDFTVQEIKRLKRADTKLGIETDSHIMTVQRYEKLRAALPHASFIDCSGFMWELRLRKSEAEIQYLRQAAAVADAIAQSVIAAASEGRSERGLAAAGYSTAMAKGADNGRVLVLTSGPSSDRIHGRLGHRQLSRGDIIHLEVLPQIRGYSSRLMRPIVIGEPADKQRWIADRLIAIQDEQLAALHVGASASEIDRIARSQVLGDGLRASYSHLTGYTLGYHGQLRTSDHTRTFQPTATWRVEAGMVFHMWLAAAGMAFSETVLMRPERMERLTCTPRVLFTR